MTLARRESRYRRWRLYLPVLLGLALALGLTVFATDLVQRQVDRDIEQELQQRTDFVATKIASRMQTYSYALLQMRGLLALVPNLNQAQLEAYVAQIDLMNRYPGLRGIGLARRVPTEDLARHVLAMRLQGMLDYRVFPPASDPDAFPVVLLAPLDQSNKGVIGFDMYSDKVRQAAMHAAASSGSVQLSGAVHLKGLAANLPSSLGCMIYVPVYKAGAAIDSVAARLSAVTGIFYSPFRAQDLFNSIFGVTSSVDQEVTFRIFDNDPSGPQTLLYDRELATDAKARDHAGGAPLTRDLSLAGRTWTLVVRPLPGLYHGIATRLPIIVFLVGLLISLALTRVLYAYAAQSLHDRQGRQRAEATALRARLLAQCGTILNSSAKGQAGIQRLADQVVADFAEVCTIHLVDARGTWELNILAQREDQSNLDFQREINRLLNQSNSPFTAHMREQAPASTLATSMISKFKAAGVGSFVSVPLTVGGRCRGFMTFIRSARHLLYCQEDLAYGEEVAGRVAMALENSQLYAEIREAKEQAEAANRAKSTFLANISHEIRTPLGAVLGFADMLQDQHLNATDRAAFTATIVRNARELSHLIDDLLDLSKVEAGKIDIERLPTRILDVLTDIKTSLGLRAEAKGIVLAINIAAEVPDQVLTDPTRLRQILLNLIGNALKFTAEGRVEVDVSYVPGVGDDAQVVFRVKDTGPGIARESQSALFQPFTQADASTTRRYGGTGLGLVLSRLLARALGGDVALEQSVVGEGSTFVVTIAARPVVIDSSVEAPAYVAERPGSKALSRGKKLDGLHLLLAEDLPDNQLLITRLLKASGATVDVVDNGLAAIESASQTSYDLVLMDLQMPLLDGFGATLELRRLGLTIPIVALTAHALREERDKCLAAGCDDHLTKPVNPQLLIRTVAYFTAKNSLDQARVRSAATPLPDSLNTSLSRP